MTRARARLIRLLPLALLVTAAAAVLAVAALRSRGDAVEALRTVARKVDALRPDIAWASSAPEREGLDPGCLEGLRADLAGRRTAALLVARNGYLVHEWYEPGRTMDERHYTAALAKALAGSMALALSLQGDWIELDDRVSTYVPSWRGEPGKSAVTVAQLASHSSGLEDVDFLREEEGWRSRYFRHRDARFALALRRGELRSPPGERYQYSGMGYYVLSYALANSLQGSGYPDLRALLRERLMTPLGIEEDAWRIGYGETYHVDGMRQVAIGSGGAYVPRAVARIGQLIVNRGRWEGRTLVSPEWMERLMQPWSPSPPEGFAPRAALGWWVNTDGFWPSLPRDAVVGAGIGHQLLLVVPSEALVAVRMGHELERPRAWGPPFWEAAGEHFVAPLMECVTERRSGGARERPGTR